MAESDADEDGGEGPRRLEDGRGEARDEVTTTSSSAARANDGGGGGRGRKSDGDAAAKDEEELDEDQRLDRFGFLVADSREKHLEVTERVAEMRREKEIERTRKWVKMIKDWTRYMEVKDRKLKRRVRKGVPDIVRDLVWCRFCDVDALRAELPNMYAMDVSRMDESALEQIERDVDRTFPRHTQFSGPDAPGQSSLRRILQWYAALDRDVGYCQGMGFIAGLLLTYMIEENAFFCFYRIMNRPSAPLRNLFLPKLVETKKMLFVFEELCKQFLGSLWHHMLGEGMHPTMFFTEWIMTMFCRGFHFDFVTRVWDIFMLEGSIKVVYRVSLALLKNIEPRIKAARFEKIMEIMRELPSTVDAPAVIDLMWTIPLKTTHIAALEKQFEDMEAAAK